MESENKPTARGKGRRAGQIRQRGDRKWLVRIFLGRDPRTGKRLEANHTVHGSKKDAQAFLNAKLRERDLGTYTGVQHTTMGALFDDLLADYRINGKSIGWAEIVVEVHLRPFFGTMKAANVGTDAIRKYIEHRQKPDKREYKDANGNKRERAYGPASNGTVNREMTLLRRSFNLGKLATPPKVAMVPHIPMLSENAPRKGFFEHEAFLALRMALPEEIRPVITFAYHTGCRKGEILALRWSQVDFAERVIRLNREKPRTTRRGRSRCWPTSWRGSSSGRRPETNTSRKAPGCSRGSANGYWTSAEPGRAHRRPLGC
jgi:Phage integrase family